MVVYLMGAFFSGRAMRVGWESVGDGAKQAQRPGNNMSVLAAIRKLGSVPGFRSVGTYDSLHEYLVKCIGVEQVQ